MTIIPKVTSQNLPFQCNLSLTGKNRFFNIWQMHALEPIWVQLCLLQAWQVHHEGSNITFTSEPSCPLANGLEKSDTDSLLDFFETKEDISYQTALWDVPMESGKTALISCLNVDRYKGFAEINHKDDLDFIEPRQSAQIC
jgi:hypothetical protein